MRIYLDGREKRKRSRSVERIEGCAISYVSRKQVTDAKASVKSDQVQAKDANNIFTMSTMGNFVRVWWKRPRTIVA